MAILTGGIICTAQTAQLFASGPLNSEVELQLDIAGVINTAIENGLFTTTVSISGESSADIQNCTNLLQSLGYTFSISSTTLTINW